jgi:hypothetical protein
MKRGWNKSGQFYLIAAIILATIIVGIAAVTNYSKRETNVRLTELKEELQIESAKVMDYGISKNFNDAQIYGLLNDFTQEYINSESRDKSLYFVFGDRGNITVKGYQKSARTVSLGGSTITSSSGQFIGGINPSGESVTLSIDSSTHEFELKPGKNFYFVISQEIDGGEYVVNG